MRRIGHGLEWPSCRGTSKTTGGTTVESRNRPDTGRARRTPRCDRGDDVRRVESSQLLGPAGLLEILHQGEHYWLRRTRNGKLILTK
ncbi:hemin uptake protein HemP [Billgrantia azerbaijanica]|nr:hemin uptake protein HemP [Halomonas azerbaijanica]